MLEQIERELIVDAPPEDVWEVVTSSGWLAADVHFDLVPGGEASFSCEEWSKQGWVEEAVEPGEDDAGLLVFWWSSGEEPATRVELTLEPEGEGITRVRVVEARPLEVLDVVGIPMAGGGGASPGPSMLVAA
jgi:uncharacterized protein YndB with AHSA1/START domain